MADVRGFPALRYADLEPTKLAPPYDVLDEEQVARYRGLSDHNVVRLTRPGGDYQRAAGLIGEWLRSGVLVQETEPVMYVHETEFDGRRRRDLVAVLRLQPYAEGAILPHERTHRGPKEDRLALLQATATCLEPLWFLHDGGLSLEAAPAAETRAFEWAGEQHRLGTVRDREWQESVSRALAASPLLIADGHHRYETALAYSEEVGGGPEAASRFTLALVTDLHDPGLLVLPTHRLLKAGIAVTGGEPADSLEATLSAIRGRTAAGTYRDGRYQVLPLEGEVAVAELHRQVIDNLLGKRSAEEFLVYTRDAAEAVRWVDEGRGVAAFFLDRPDLAAVLKVAQAGKTMPQKTTYFHPKPPSGLAFHRLDPGRNL